MFKLPDHISEKFLEAQRDSAARKQVFALLSNDDLVVSAKFWMAHCNAPKAVKPGEPIYDATFWYEIMPEILRRLSK